MAASRERSQVHSDHGKDERLPTTTANAQPRFVRKQRDRTGVLLDRRRRPCVDGCLRQATVRRRLRNSPFDICAACLEAFVLPEVLAKHPKLSREKALFAAVEVMEAEVRKSNPSAVRLLKQLR
jgi:hypothetical protein